MKQNLSDGFRVLSSNVIKDVVLNPKTIHIGDDIIVCRLFEHGKDNNLKYLLVNAKVKVVNHYPHDGYALVTYETSHTNGSTSIGFSQIRYGTNRSKYGNHMYDVLIKPDEEKVIKSEMEKNNITRYDG